MVELRDEGTVWGGGGGGGREVSTLSMTRTKCQGIMYVALRADDKSGFSISLQEKTRF